MFEIYISEKVRNYLFRYFIFIDYYFFSNYVNIFRWINTHSKMCGRNGNVYERRN